MRRPLSMATAHVSQLPSPSFFVYPVADARHRQRSQPLSAFMRAKMRAALEGVRFQVPRGTRTRADSHSGLECKEMPRKHLKKGVLDPFTSSALDLWEGPGGS